MSEFGQIGNHLESLGVMVFVKEILRPLGRFLGPGRGEAKRFRLLQVLTGVEVGRRRWGSWGSWCVQTRTLRLANINELVGFHLPYACYGSLVLMLLRKLRECIVQHLFKRCDLFLTSSNVRKAGNALLKAAQIF